MRTCGYQYTMTNLACRFHLHRRVQEVCGVVDGQVLHQMLLTQCHQLLHSQVFGSQQHLENSVTGNTDLQEANTRHRVRHSWRVELVHFVTDSSSLTWPVSSFFQHANGTLACESTDHRRKAFRNTTLSPSPPFICTSSTVQWEYSKE